MSSVDKKTLEYLAGLARIELDPKEEKELLRDLQKILDYFEEMKTLDTSKIEPLTGGANMKNIFREDEERRNTNRGAGTESFPETEKGFLKIPPVFEAHE